MEQLIELLEQIRDLAGAGIDALKGAGEGGGEQGGDEGAPPEGGGEGRPPAEEPEPEQK